MMMRAIGAGALAGVFVVCVLLMSGCQPAERAEADLQVERRARASREGLTPARAREIVAEVTGVDVDDVTLMHRVVEDRVARILAAVPAPDEMLYEESRNPTMPESITEQTLETVDVQWDLDANLPTEIIWSERLQFAAQERFGEEQAAAIALKLLEQWVPEEAGAIEPQPVQRLYAPVYIISWVGMVDGVHVTGDRAVVHVSSVTGLPILFRQRIARQRPSPDEIAVTRDEAMAAVRDHLRREGESNAESIDLVAQLTLSAAGHPEGGPAWLVAVIGPRGEQQRGVVVDAMSGEVMVSGPRDRRAARQDDGERSEETGGAGR